MTPLDSEKEPGAAPVTDAPTERERWDAERSDRKIDQSQKDREIEVKLIELRRSRFSPLAVAIIAAATALGATHTLCIRMATSSEALKTGRPKPLAYSRQSRHRTQIRRLQT